MRLRTDDVTWREIDGDLVVLDLRSSTYLTANASGSVLMQELTEDRTLQQLAQALVDAFGIPDPQAQRDAVAFVQALEDQDLLESGRQRPRHPVVVSGGR